MIILFYKNDIIFIRIDIFRIGKKPIFRFCINSILTKTYLRSSPLKIKKNSNSLDGLKSFI
jgi:hypothetical protein